jgi:hypothetical protein
MFNLHEDFKCKTMNGMVVLTMSYEIILLRRNIEI